MVFIIVVFLFPSTPAPVLTAETMNYTVVVLCGWFLLSLVWYYLPGVGGVHWFNGPVPNVDDSHVAQEKYSDTGSVEKD
jgi:hypothetical protein